jgi:hypothetical protein
MATRTGTGGGPLLLSLSSAREAEPENKKIATAIKK